VIAPLAALGCAALAIGFENHDLRRRFGDQARGLPLLHLAPATDDRPTMADRVSLYILVFLPWLVMYEGLGHLAPAPVYSTYLPVEASWPTIPLTELVYVVCYPFGLLAPLLLRTRRELRRFEVAGLVGTVLGGLAFFALPLHAHLKPIDAHGLLGWMIEFERADEVGGRNALPSFHVFWAVLGAWALAARGRGTGAIGWLLGAAITVSCVTTGMHSVADLVAGAALAWACLYAEPIWVGLSRAAELIANSWREWRIGPLRIINHGAYAGLAAVVGILI